MARAASSEARQIRELVQSFKRASSAEAESESASQDEDESGDDEDIVPFFPTAFSEPDSPLQFNFANRPHDTLSFHCKLSADLESHGRKSIQRFADIGHLDKALSAWYGDFLCFLDTQSKEKTQQTLMAARAKLNKWEIFKRSGRPLRTITSGNNDLDTHNDKVRLDAFENVMVFGAPAWSDAATQFCHGFPSALIRAHHGGYTPGNITCTSKASNDYIRAFTFKDIFTLSKLEPLQKTGLSAIEAVYCRTIAMEAKRSEKSKRLAEAMFR